MSHASDTDFRRTGTTRERWYTAPSTLVALGTAALVADRMYAHHFVVPKDITLDMIGINVTTLSAGGLMRLGIYEDNNGEPGSLLLDAGEVDTSTTGVKTIAINQPLIAFKPYWLVMLSNNATHVIRGTGSALLNTMGYSSSLGTAAINGLYAGQAYGALPSTFPTVSNQTGSQPLVFVRLSA